MTIINEELQVPLRARVAADYEKWVRGAFDGLVKRLGPTLPGVYSGITDPDAYFTFREISGCLQQETRNGVIVRGAPYTLSETKLQKYAERRAVEEVAAWVSKLNAKCGELEGAEVVWGELGAEYSIVGTRGVVISGSSRFGCSR